MDCATGWRGRRSSATTAVIAPGKLTEGSLSGGPVSRRPSGSVFTPPGSQGSRVLCEQRLGDRSRLRSMNDWSVCESRRAIGVAPHSEWHRNATRAGALTDAFLMAGDIGAAIAPMARSLTRHHKILSVGSSLQVGTIDLKDALLKLSASKSD